LSSRAKKPSLPIQADRIMGMIASTELNPRGIVLDRAGHGAEQSSSGLKAAGMQMKLFQPLAR